MNSAFKFDTRAWWTSLMLATAPMSVIAVDCATLNVSADKQQIVSIASKVVRPPVYLAPGWHTMNITPVNNDLNAPQKSYDFTVQVAKDHHYQLAIVDSSVKAPVKIVKQTVNHCDVDDLNTVHPAQFNETTGLSNNVQLPAPLEYRLRKLMSKIAHYHSQTNGQQTSVNVLLGTQMNQFGAVLNNQNADDQLGVQVLAVSPLSQASKLGLTSGDTIISLGTLPLDNQTNISHQSVEQYINQLVYGDTIAVTIKRHGKNLSLNGTFQPVTIPSAFYQL